MSLIAKRLIDNFGRVELHYKTKGNKIPKSVHFFVYITVYTRSSDAPSDIVAPRTMIVCTSTEKERERERERERDI